MSRLLYLIMSSVAVAAVYSVSPSVADEAQPTAAPLASYNVDTKQISVSGVSSGAYMAVQFEVAHSDLVMGAGAIAGGPYYCAQGSLRIASANCVCMRDTGCDSPMYSNVPDLIQKTYSYAADQFVAPTENLSKHKVWVFSGTRDTKVLPTVTNDLVIYYRSFVPAENIQYINYIPAEHAVPIKGDPSSPLFVNECGKRADPFISDCHYDAAGALFEWIYGMIQPRQKEKLTGSFLRFRQDEFLDKPTEHGMAEEGRVYVPKVCQDRKTPCKLHVAFHGCKQAPNYKICQNCECTKPFGDIFVRYAGYNEWADTNDIIVLYPQAEPIVGYPGAQNNNPHGCWNIWGFDDADYANRKGLQIAAVRKMIERITGQPSAQ